MADVTLEDPITRDRATGQLPVFLPHEVFGALFAASWTLFSSVLFGGIPQDLVPTLLSFHWTSVSGGVWARRHPCFTSHEHLRQWIIPFRCHGDDASVKSITGRKLVIFSVHSEFAEMDALVSRLLTWICYDDQLVSGVTIPELMVVIKWSFDSLLQGTYPALDHLGRPWPAESARARLANTLLAGGFRGAFAGSLGDWAWHSKMYYPHLHGSSHNYLCCRDAAARHIDALRFEDIGPNAGWRATSISTAVFLAALPSDHNAMFDTPGWDLSLVRVDMMHCCFLGLFAVVCGNVFWELHQLGHFCPLELTIVERLNHAFWSLTSYCRRYKLKLCLRQFTPHTFSSPDSPELNSKAHDCRIMVGWLAKECLTSPDVHSAAGKRRLAIAYWQRELAESMEQAPRYLFGQFLDRVSRAGDEFLTLYVSFCLEFKAAEPPRWKALRKLHPFVHMMEDLALDRLNPRFFAGWTDESLMGKVVHMAYGQNMRSAPLNVLTAWWPMFVESHR